MITIRQNVFETNSSSVHAIVVSPNSSRQIPQRIYFNASNEYGWENECYESVADRADYIYAAICQIYDDSQILNWKNRLTEICDTVGCTAVFEDEEGIGYVDHAGELAELLETLYNDDELLLSYLFGNDSIVCTSNDNGGYDGYGSHDLSAADAILDMFDIVPDDGDYIYEKSSF